MLGSASINVWVMAKLMMNTAKVIGDRKINKIDEKDNTSKETILTCRPGVMPVIHPTITPTKTDTKISPSMLKAC
jgi:hypothetical protein